MGIVSVRLGHIADAEKIQLCVPRAAGDIDREQDGPCNQGSDAADQRHEFQEPEK
jgi:hypothetical protein